MFFAFSQEHSIAGDICKSGPYSFGFAEVVGVGDQNLGECFGAGHEQPFLVAVLAVSDEAVVRDRSAPVTELCRSRCCRGRCMRSLEE